MVYVINIQQHEKELLCTQKGTKYENPPQYSVVYRQWRVDLMLPATFEVFCCTLFHIFIIEEAWQVAGFYCNGKKAFSYVKLQHA